MNYRKTTLVFLLALAISALTVQAQEFLPVSVSTAVLGAADEPPTNEPIIIRATGGTFVVTAIQGEAGLQRTFVFADRTELEPFIDAWFADSTTPETRFVVGIFAWAKASVEQRVVTRKGLSVVLDRQFP